MKLNAKKILFVIIVSMFVLMIIGMPSFASEKIDTNQYNAPLDYDDANDIFSMGATIIKLLRNIAIVVSVLVISILGIKYMLGSVDQKAEYKETMMPVVIGCILVSSITAILSTIQSIFQN